MAGASSDQDRMRVSSFVSGAPSVAADPVTPLASILDELCPERIQRWSMAMYLEGGLGVSAARSRRPGTASRR
jgi:hypothetical protein